MTRVTEVAGGSLDGERRVDSGDVHNVELKRSVDQGACAVVVRKKCEG